jgi:diguanylate cyclase (GGDEF)-like protein
MNPYQREIIRLRELLQAERRAARTDHLTGLENRRSLDCLAADLFAGAVRDYAVLAIDLANLHACNVQLGHDAGDAALRRLAASIRDYDHAFRVGGDEFVVVLTQQHKPSDAVTVANRIRDVFGLTHVAPGIAVFAAIGVAWPTRTGAMKYQDLAPVIAEAQRRMQLDKADTKARYGLHADARATLAD